VIGNTGVVKDFIVAWPMLILAAVILVMDIAAASPNAPGSIAEIVSNCSSGGGEGVVGAAVGIIVAPRFEMMRIPAKVAFGTSCLASMSLWMWFLCDLPLWRAWTLNAAAKVGEDNVKRRCSRVKVDAGAFQRVISVIFTIEYLAVSKYLREGYASGGVCGDVSIISDTWRTQEGSK
jgi:hypothetical protein